MDDGYTEAYTDASGLTWDKLLEAKAALKTIYYMVSRYIPKEIPLTPGGLPEPGVIGVDIEGYPVWILHPDFLPGFLEAAVENGWEPVDFRGVKYWQTRPFTPAVIEMEVYRDLVEQFRQAARWAANGESQSPD